VTPTSPTSTPYQGLGGSGGYDISRFNPAYDRLEEGSVIEDWIPRDLPGINKMLRIIYNRDAIAGPAVDIMAQLPWSEFDLHGIEDKGILEFYEGASQLFGDKAQDMPAITTEFLVLGRFCASLLYDEDKGYWTDFVPHDSDFLTITPIPIRGFDPKIDLVLSPGIRQFLQSQDYRDQVAVKQLPPELLQSLRAGGAIPLDPLATLYVRRKSSPYDHVGTSIYTRIIPYWALEKALMNASVTAARRRAGNILHVQAGIEDKWEPSPQEMDDIAGLFIQADEDPVGAVVATRTGVEASEIRQGGDIWKWSEEWQTFAEGKMRGLGISEALLSGDATYNNMEQARSVFTEQIIQLRQYLTNQVYYRRFKTLARAHGFRKTSKANLDHRVRIRKSGGLNNLSHEEAMEIPEDDLIVPTMQWRKSLLPEGDREYLELLEMLKEQGVPIPLKVWAARGGYDIHEAMDMLDDDIKMRKQIDAWKKATSGDGEEEGGAWGEAENEGSPFWDRSQQFLQLSRGEARACLKHLVGAANEHADLLGDVDEVMRVLHGQLGNRRKVELMAYLLMRLQLTASIPISHETAEDIATHLLLHETLSERRRHQELTAFAQITGRRTPNVTAASASPDVLTAEVKEQVDRAQSSEFLDPTAPTLLSGAA